MLRGSSPVWLVLLAAAFVSPAAESSRAPVLVELFTSEGCSSCPPADRILEQLDPHAIVLSEHVDYWDHEGWKDPYSSPRFTQRQENYVRQFGIDGAYTPEMVVDGMAQFNGSNGRRAQDEIAKATERKKAAIRLSRSDAGLDIQVENAPRSTSVWLVLAENAAASQVSGGENKGRRITHVAVVRSLQKVGSVKAGQPFRKSVELRREDAGKRVVVFLQSDGVGLITGAAVLEPHTAAP